jgi:glycosyltransferase involved in cell wall biosynthesis
VRILFDARSVRTPAGAHIFQGLLRGWKADARVAALFAAVTPSSRIDGVPEGIEVVRLPHTGWIRHLTRELPALAARCRADIIFSPNATPPRDERAVLYFQDLKHVRRDQHHRLPWRYRAGEFARSAWRRLAAPRCALAVCVSEDIADDVRRSLPLPVSVIPNGVDVDGVWWNGERDAVIVMGGIGPWKGEQLAIRAWSTLGRVTRGATLLDVIGVEPLERRQSLYALAAQLEVADSVRVRGVIGRHEFLRAVAEGQAAVSCSEFESFGLPVAEALMMGAPVFCSDLPAHAELLARASAGAAFRVGDCEALAVLLRKLLSGEAPSRRLTAPDGWTWNHRARQHVDAFLEHVSHVRH